MEQAKQNQLIGSKFMTDLQTSIGEISLRAPLILAAGVLGTSFSSMKRVYINGFGAMVTKSIGIKPNPG